MNARQKAKKYKRLYEGLLKQPKPIVFAEPHQIDTLRFERVYPEELMLEKGDQFSNFVQRDIAQGLAEGLGKYIVYRTDYYSGMNIHRVCGEIKVVVM